MGLKEDYNYCENIIRKNSKSFYSAFSRLSEEKAKDIYAVYAFCRTVDDIVDLNQSKKQLDLFKSEWENFKRGHVESKPFWKALENTFSRYDMSFSPFDDMIEGQYSDLEFTQPKNQRELENYCYYVAGTVSLMILPILSANHKNLKENAVSLGKAMQITNILRDIGEDYDKKRIYLPISVMEKFGYDEKNLDEKTINKNFIEMWEFEAQRAEELYNVASGNLMLYDKDSVLPVIFSIKLYKDILNSVRSNGYDCLRKKNYVKKPRKIFLYIQSVRLKQNIGFSKEKHT